MVVTNDQQQNQNVDDDCHPTNATLVPTIPIIVAAGFLGAKEVCALSATSKELYHTVNQDSIWACLTLRDHPCVKLLPQSVLETNGYRCAYRMYNTSFTTKRKKPFCPMPPPRLTVNDMELQFQFKCKSGGVVVPIGGDLLSHLLQTGSAVYELSKPVALTKAKWGKYKQGDLKTSEDFDQHKDEKGRYPIWGKDLAVAEIEIIVYLVDKTDYSMSCVFDSRKGPLTITPVGGHPFAHPIKRSMEDKVSPNSGMDKSDQNCSIVLFGPQEYGRQLALKEVQCRKLTLSFSEAANSIANRLSAPIAFCCGFRLGLVDNMNSFGIDHICVIAVKGGDDHVEWFNSEIEAEKHGVTLLHILSELSMHKPTSRKRLFSSTS